MKLSVNAEYGQVFVYNFEVLKEEMRLFKEQETDKIPENKRFWEAGAHTKSSQILGQKEIIESSELNILNQDEKNYEHYFKTVSSGVIDNEYYTNSSYIKTQIIKDDNDSFRYLLLPSPHYNAYNGFYNKMLGIIEIPESLYDLQLLLNQEFDKISKRNNNINLIEIGSLFEYQLCSNYNIFDTEDTCLLLDMDDSITSLKHSINQQERLCKVYCFSLREYN